MRTPSLRQHATGIWFTHWGGQDHYFTKDRRASEALYHASLADWSSWRQTPASSRPPMGRGSARRRAYRLAEVVDLFLAAVEPDVSPRTVRYYETQLARFVNLWGRAPMHRLGPQELSALKIDMVRMGIYSTATINHDLVAVKCLFNWAAGMGYITAVDLRRVRRIPLEPPAPRALSIDQLRLMLECADRGHGDLCDLRTRKRFPKRTDPQVGRWLRLSYLALLRPMETLRLVHGDGELVEPGVFRLRHSKTSRRSQVPRCLVLSESALGWLSRCAPRWSTLDGYYHAVARCCGLGGSHPLRHSGATHLKQLGAAREDIDLILGHYPRRVSLSYAPIAWPPLRATAERLAGWAGLGAPSS